MEWLWPQTPAEKKREEEKNALKPKRDDTSALGNIAAFLSGKKKPVFDERAQVILPALPASLKVTRAALCGTALQNRSCKHVAYRGGTAEYSTLGSAVHRSTPVTVGSAQYCSQSGCRLGPTCRCRLALLALAACQVYR